MDSSDTPQRSAWSARRALDRAKPLLALGGALLVVAALIVALVVVAAIAVVDLATPVLAAAIVVAAAASSHRVGLLSPAFAGEAFELASVALLELVVHLALCIRSNLFDLHAAIMAVVLASVVNRLKILGESLKILVAELATGANKLGSVGLVEGHIEPFHLKTCAGGLDVARG